jgi:hypothetical protein
MTTTTSKTTNKALYSLFIMVIVVAGLSFAPAFAASSVSTGPWNIQQEIPSYMLVLAPAQVRLVLTQDQAV